MKKKRFCSSFVRLMFAGFLVLSLVILFAGFMINVVGIEQVRQAIVYSYGTALQTVADALGDQLSDAEALATITLLEDDLMRMCAVKRAQPDLYEYQCFCEDIALRLNNRSLDVRFTILLPGSMWTISTEYGVKKAKQLNNDNPWWENNGAISQWSIQPAMGPSQISSLAKIEGYFRPEQSSPAIVIEISESSLMKYLKQATASMNVVSLFVRDARGNMLYTGKTLDDSACKQVFEEDCAMVQRISAQNGITYPGLCFQVHGISFGVLFDESSLLKSMIWLRQWTLVLFAICMMICGLFARIGYQRVVIPLRLLMKSMDLASAGDLSASVNLKHDDEFGHLAWHYNHMLNQIHQLIEEQYLKQLQLQKSQLRFLRSQIRPHFLYNCLFSLYTMIKNGDCDNAANMAVYLGRYYQSSTRIEESEIPLSEELENVHVYVNINKIRYVDKLTYQEWIDPTVKDFSIPALLLMTLLENVVTHGIKAPTCPVQICVEAFSKEENVILRVSDTGMGMDENERQAIMEKCSAREFDENAHGLANIMMRLRMAYGQNATIEISQNVPAGTVITIVIPNERRENTHV